jgi:hypothetical protein
MPVLGKTTRRWIAAPIRRVVLAYRRASWRSRPLPDFIIIGAQKSGSTSLYRYLGQHPQLFPSFSKEVHFFDGGLNPSVDNFRKGQGWYRAHFPFKRDLGPRGQTFEASPLYLFNPLAPGRIFDLIPEVRLIAVLRNPTERAISHYFHVTRDNNEPLPILEALQEEEKRLEPVIRNRDYKSNTFMSHSYKSRGIYRDQIARYLDCFSRAQLLIIKSEDLFAQPADTLSQVFSFLGVDPQFQVKDLKPRNVASNRSQVAPEVYEYLDSYFRPHNQALYELIGQDYGW